MAINEKPTVLSVDDTKCLKAISIVMIVLHNLLHIKSGFHENEFTFSENVVSQALSAEWGVQTFSMIFSYFGWYGVPCFVFLTGYGLTAKYLLPNGQLSKFSLVGHIRKLLLLIAPIIVLFVCLYFFGQKPCGFRQIISTATLTANLFFYERLSIEWYFGLCAQLYALWYLCYVKRWVNDVAIFILCVGLLFCSISLFPDWQIPIRHNFIGWCIPFFFGCWFHKIKLPDIVCRHRLISASVMLVLFIITSLFRYLWPFSDLFLIMSLVLSVKYLRFKPILFVGTISASIYVMQQIVRRYFLPLPFDYTEYAISISLLYLLINIAVAYLWHIAVKYISKFIMTI